MKEHILSPFIIATDSENCEHVNDSISLLARAHVPEGVRQYSLFFLLHSSRPAICTLFTLIMMLRKWFLYTF